MKEEIKPTFKGLVVLESAKFRVVSFSKAINLDKETEVVGYLDENGKAWAFEGGLLDRKEIYEVLKESKKK